MVYDPEAKITVILFTTLSAVPSNGENAAVAVFRQAIVPSILGGRAASGSPTGATTTTAG